MATLTNCSLSSLYNLPTPERTASWTPIPHTRARLALVNALDAHGIEVNFDREEIQFTSDGAVAFGILPLDIPTRDGTWRPETLWFNAHDKSRAYTLGAGERVNACTNGCVWAETVLRTRRTSGVFDRLDSLARDFVGQLAAQVRTNEQRRDEYSRHLVGENWARVLLVRLAEAKVFPSSQILPALAEYLAPSFEYDHRPDTLLGLQSAVTHTLKRYSIAGQHDRSLKLVQLLDAECNFG